MTPRSPAQATSLGARTGAALRSPRWRRRLGWAVCIWLLLWALAYVAVPLALKSQLQAAGSEKLGRQITVGAVDFKPWSLELTVHDLAVARAAAPGAPTPLPGQPAQQLHIRRIYIDFELQSLLRWAPVADALVMDEPVAFVTHLGQGRYDIDDILARFESPDPQPRGTGARFALYNLVLNGGRLDVADAAVQTSHSLRDLTVAVPFLSNLPSQREIKTAPHLAFTLNGSRFDTAAVSTPFAPNRQTDAAFTLRDFDLQPYLNYLPAGLPFRLEGGVLQADLHLAFEQSASPSLRISGKVTAAKVRLAQPRRSASASETGGELLAMDLVRVVLDDVRPLERVVKLSLVEIDAPVLSVARDRAGRLNLLPAANPVATKIIADTARATSANAQKYHKDADKQLATPARPWQVEIARLALDDGVLNWRDDTPASPVQIRLQDLALNASGFAYPFLPDAPFQFGGSFGLDTTPAAAPAPRASQPAAAQLKFKGSATDRSADVTAQAEGWPIGLAASYLGQWLKPDLTGQLSADAGLTWRAAAPSQPAVLRLSVPALTVNALQLAENGLALATVQSAELQRLDVDLPGKSFKAASLRISQPKLAIERDAGGRWMVARWLASPESAAPLPATAASAAPPSEAPGNAPASWAVAIGEVLLEGGAASFADKAGARAVAFDVTAVNARLGGLALGGSPAAKAPAKAQEPVMSLAASFKLGAGQTRPGSLDFKGDVGLGPLAVRGQLTAERLPAQAFKPYLAGAVNIDLLRADTSFKGQVAYRQSAAGAQAEVAGDAALEAFSANTLAPSEELLAWKALQVRGLKVVVEPARATQIDVRETVLSDFFARVIVTPEGRVNLQDLLKPPASGSGARVAGPTPADATKSIAANAGGESVRSQNDPKNPSGTALPPVITIGPISLQSGQVRFSDRFIKPNYSADLSELTGKLGGFSSGTPGNAAAPAMADLELRGKAEGTASLEIAGKFNPLVTPLALSITGKVRDLELPPLSPYAIKYAGYGIERGKMSVDVTYVVEPNGQLTARNKLVLNQLSFGDKAEGANASLPVKLAVALLADRNGVIDLELPISGSLNDPQFSLWPVIGKVIGNVVARAITAPFSLLARALGGSGDELAQVEFAAGSAQFAPDARASLDKVAKALTDRPGLQLTVTGTSSLDAERDAFQRTQLAERVRAEKRRQQAGQGMAATEPLTVSPDEYPALLKSLYGQSDLERPRNLIGMLKDQPVAEMEKLLLSGIGVGSDDLRQLASRRAQEVKDYLVSRDLPPARLSLAAAKTVPPGSKWTPHAELNLAMP